MVNAMKTEGCPITYLSEQDKHYAAELRTVSSESALRGFLFKWKFLAHDAYGTLMDGFDWDEFSRGRVLENRGEFAGEVWCEKYGAILMPEILMRVSIVAMKYGAPWGCAYIRLREAGVIQEAPQNAVWVEGKADET